MIRSLAQHIIGVFMVATLTVAVAEAQSGAGSDFTGPFGGGGGASGSIPPRGVFSGFNPVPLSAAGADGLNGVFSLFAFPGLGGFSVTNPAGGTVTISPSTAGVIGTVLSSGTPAVVQSLQKILVGEGLQAAAAGSLANALSAFGAAARSIFPAVRATQGRALVAAIEAFNVAIDAGPSVPGPAMLAIRFALASASR